MTPASPSADLSDWNALRFFVALFQLLLPKANDFRILAFGDGSQRQNLSPVDPVPAGEFPGAVTGRQFQHLVCDLQPILCREFPLFNLLKKFTQE